MKKESLEIKKIKKFLLTYLSGGFADDFMTLPPGKRVACAERLMQYLVPRMKSEEMQPEADTSQFAALNALLNALSESSAEPQNNQSDE